MDYRSFLVNGQWMRFECGDWKLHTENGIVDIGNTYSHGLVTPLASLGHHYPWDPVIVSWERPDGTRGELAPNGDRVEVTEGMRFTVQRHSRTKD